jgi:hypothetical protein
MNLYFTGLQPPDRSTLGSSTLAEVVDELAYVRNRVLVDRYRGIVCYFNS